jgi:hypothetical protein
LFASNFSNYPQIDIDAQVSYQDQLFTISGNFDTPSSFNVTGGEIELLQTPVYVIFPSPPSTQNSITAQYAIRTFKSVS